MFYTFSEPNLFTFSVFSQIASIFTFSCLFTYIGIITFEGATTVVYDLEEAALSGHPAGKRELRKLPNISSSGLEIISYTTKIITLS